MARELATYSTGSLLAQAQQRLHLQPGGAGAPPRDTCTVFVALRSGANAIALGVVTHGDQQRWQLL